MSSYDDIIGLPRPVSGRHRPMPLEARAAQFAPFAALSGHDDAIGETARLTSERVELDRLELEALSGRLRLAADRQSRVRISFFVPDVLKSGGRYVSVSGVIKRIDTIEGNLLLADGTRIPLADIRSVD